DHGPLRRAQEDRLAGGIAAGLSRRTGIDVMVIRTALVVGTLLTGGFIAFLYVVAWLMVPAAGAESNIARKAITDRRGIALAVGLVSLLIIVLPLVSALHLGWPGNFSWPAFFSAAGLVLIWRNAPGDEQAVVRRLVGARAGRVPRH